MTEEVEKLTKQVENLALRGASKEDIARIEKLISEGKSSTPSTPPPVVVEPSVEKDDLEELKKYRETERQALLTKLPKKVIKEFKLEKESLKRVKEISNLTQALKKRDVGIDTPTTDTTTKEKKFQWNPDTLKNEMC